MKPPRPWLDDDATARLAVPLPLVGDALHRSRIVVIAPRLGSEWAVTQRRAAHLCAIPPEQIDHRREVADADVVVVDGGGREAVVQRLSGKRARTAVLLPAYSLTDVVLALELGADDVMGRPIDGSLLAARVNALARRADDPAANRTVLRHGGIALDDSAHEVRKDGVCVHLTLTEYILLRELLRRPGQTVARGELLRLLNDDASNPRSVDPHMYRLRRKLGPFVIRAIAGVGYRLG